MLPNIWSLGCHNSSLVGAGRRRRRRGMGRRGRRRKNLLRKQTTRSRFTVARVVEHKSGTWLYPSEFRRATNTHSYTRTHTHTHTHTNTSRTAQGSTYIIAQYTVARYLGAAKTNRTVPRDPHDPAQVAPDSHQIRFAQQPRARGNPRRAN